MDWFLYDRDLRHERVTYNLTLSLNSKAVVFVFLYCFLFFLFCFVLIFLSADYMHSIVSILVVSDLRAETKVAGSVPSLAMCSHVIL